MQSITLHSTTLAGVRYETATASVTSDSFPGIVSARIRGYSCSVRVNKFWAWRQVQSRISQRARRVTEFIDDFSPLRQLEAFSALEH
jgi:hypothetical protein